MHVMYPFKMHEIALNYNNYVTVILICLLLPPWHYMSYVGWLYSSIHGKSEWICISSQFITGQGSCCGFTKQGKNYFTSQIEAIYTVDVNNY